MGDDNVNAIEIEAAEPPRRLQIKPPPNYASRAVQRRLFLLVAALMLVLVLMREAGRPENWAWMGFDSPGAATPKAPFAPGDGGRHDLLTPASPGSGPAEDDIDAENSGLPIDSLEWRESESAWRQSVWREVFQALDARQRRLWFAVLLSGRRNSPDGRHPPAAYRELAPLIDTVVKHRIASDWERLHRSELATQDQLEALSAWTVALSDDWTARLLPALDAAADQALSPEHRAACDAWFEQVSPAVWETVMDHTESARPAEGPAALVAWDTVMAPNAHGAPRQVTAFELLSNPQAFRGQPVTVAGELQLVEIIDTPKNDLGIERYFAMWIKPREGGRTPFCVYALALPNELAQPNERYTDYRAPVEVSGLFFKIRNYLDSREQLAYCPLLFARTARVVPATAMPPDADNPPAWRNWALVWSLIPILAVWIAWRVYRESRRAAGRRSQVRERQIAQSLQRLTGDSSVQTPVERIAEWARREQEDKSGEGG